MRQGRIEKALSGYYYVNSDGEIITCRARGRFRLDGTSPLVGDRVTFTVSSDGSGCISGIMERRNWFVRPAVANIDRMVMVASAANPVTDPFLIDRVSALAACHDCDILLCINKTDLDPALSLREIYRKTDIPVVCTDALSGAGVDELRSCLKDRISAFTGNSGVGKTSLLNALLPGIGQKTGEVSEKLGRGRHTTRHVELFALPFGGYIADTPGFGSFDVEQMESVRPAQLRYGFPEFGEYVGSCRFADCTHRREPGCAVCEAVAAGEISESRHASYVRLWEQASRLKDWELRDEART